MRASISGVSGAVVQELRREKLADGGHVDAVKAGRDDRRAGDADVNFPRPADLPDPLQQGLQSRAADDRVFDQQHPLAFEHFAQRRVLRFGLAVAVAAALDERPPAVAVADQPFDAGIFRA